MTDISWDSTGWFIAHEQFLVYHSVFYSSMLAENLKGGKKFHPLMLEDENFPFQIVFTF